MINFTIDKRTFNKLLTFPLAICLTAKCVPFSYHYTWQIHGRIMTVSTRCSRRMRRTWQTAAVVHWLSSWSKAKVMRKRSGNRMHAFCRCGCAMFTFVVAAARTAVYIGRPWLKYIHNLKAKEWKKSAMYFRPNLESVSFGHREVTFVEPPLELRSMRGHHWAGKGWVFQGKVIAIFF